MINNTIQNNNPSILGILRHIERLYDEKSRYDLPDERKIIRLVIHLVDEMNSSFKYRVFKLKIGRPDSVWNL